MRSVKTTTGIALLYLLMAVAVTWPGVHTISSRLIGSGGKDTLFIWYQLGWGYRSLFHGLCGFWNAPFYFPLPAMTTYSDHALGLQPFFAPAMLASGNPVLAYNATYLASLALTGLAAFLLAHRLTGEPWGSFLAGGLFLMYPQKLPHIGHLHLIALGFATLSFWSLSGYLERTRRRDLGALFAFFTMAFLTSFYNGFFLTILLFVFGGWPLAADSLPGTGSPPARLVSSPSWPSSSSLIDRCSRRCRSNS